MFLDFHTWENNKNKYKMINLKFRMVMISAEVRGEVVLRQGFFLRKKAVKLTGPDGVF